MSNSLKVCAAAGLALALSTGMAVAQDLNSSITCLNGDVPGADYAELGQKLRESLWDNRGGVSLVASMGGAKLRVVDSYQNSVCEETANNSTSCTFKVNLSLIPEFTIIVDNAENASHVTYKLCAF